MLQYINITIMRQQAVSPLQAVTWLLLQCAGCVQVATGCSLLVLAGARSMQVLHTAAFEHMNAASLSTVLQLTLLAVAFHGKIMQELLR